MENICLIVALTISVLGCEGCANKDHRGIEIDDQIEMSGLSVEGIKGDDVIKCDNDGKRTTANCKPPEGSK